MAWVTKWVCGATIFVNDYYTQSCRESRYLLFLTENYVALDILKHYLGNINAIHQHDLEEGQPEEMEPYVLFGSSFPKDKEYTQVMLFDNLLK